MISGVGILYMIIRYAALYTAIVCILLRITNLLKRNSSLLYIFVGTLNICVGTLAIVLFLQGNAILTWLHQCILNIFMKVLYAIQATGNGHVSRANEIIPILQKKCELDIIISGTQADVELNHAIKYRKKGLCFIFGKKGGVDLYKTFRQMQSRKFLSEIKSYLWSLNRRP